jgi:hypothetical protein
MVATLGLLLTVGVLATNYTEQGFAQVIGTNGGTDGMGGDGGHGGTKTSRGNGGNGPPGIGHGHRGMDGAPGGGCPASVCGT